MNELNEQQCDTKYTFWKLLSEYQVEIPIIQRDYAQGRNSAKTIRDELLNSIYDALVNGKSIDFDCSRQKRQHILCLAVIKHGQEKTF